MAQLCDGLEHLGVGHQDDGGQPLEDESPGLPDPKLDEGHGPGTGAGVSIMTSSDQVTPCPSLQAPASGRRND